MKFRGFKFLVEFVKYSRSEKYIFRVIIKEQCKIQKRENMLPLAKWKLYHSNEISICFFEFQNH